MSDGSSECDNAQCSGGDGDEEMLECSRCEGRFHAGCVGLGSVQRIHIRRDYLCAKCLRKGESNVRREHELRELSIDEIDDIVEAAIGGLLTDGEHHKQECLQDIVLKILGDVEYNRLVANLHIRGYGWGRE
jgi:hypothetical protein